MRQMLVVVMLAWGAARAEERAFLVTFDQTKIEPGTLCKGEATAEGCRLLGLTPVLFEAHDSGTVREMVAWMTKKRKYATIPGLRCVLNREGGLVDRKVLNVVGKQGRAYTYAKTPRS